MRKQYLSGAAVIVLGFCNILSVHAQKTAQKKPAAGDHCAIQEPIKENIDAQLAKFKQVKMTFNGAGLSAQERKMVLRLVEAAQDLESIFWRQADPKGLELYERLAGCAAPEAQKLRRFLMINGSRYDLVEENKPFVGDDPFYPGRALFPAGITREEIEAYVAKHPEKKNQIYSPYTVVKRQGDDLIGVPYHVEYRQWLEAAAKALKEAATLSKDKLFADFLRLRADALLTDDYFKSDLAWLDLQDPKFDIIFAPYETYLDDVLGVKTSYGVAVMVRNEEESKKLAVFQKYVPDIQDALPLAAEDRPSKRGQPTPMEVMDTPFRAGDLRHGYQAVADNLPNDARIHEMKGTKKIFFKNYMDARVNYVILPLAKRIMDAQQASQASGEGYLSDTMMHEICHGLGPAFARTTNGKMDIREAIGPLFSGVEEAKADVVGMFALKWLVDHGALPQERLQEYYASYVAGIFRTVRFGIAEAHGRAEMMEFNYLSQQGAISRTDSGAYKVDYNKMPDAIATLAKELLEIEATGDRERATKWFGQYDKMPDDLKTSLAKITDVPVDIDPVLAFPEPVK